MTGVFTSIIDTYMNLRFWFKSIKEDIHIATPWSKTPHWEKPWSVDWEDEWKRICKVNKNFGFVGKQITDSFEGDCRYFEADIVICSSRFLIDHFKEDFCINSKYLLVLDSMDLSHPEYRSYRNLDNSVWVDYDNCIWLCNPANFDQTKYKKYEWYHKFNQERLKTLKFDKKPYYYSREKKFWIKVEDGKYFENIGKGIWERLYHNVPVYYDTKGMYMRDGLYYYLKLFGVNGEVNHNPLPLYKDVIKSKKIFMWRSDIMLEILTEWLK